jgi:subtilisin family serine protease
VQQVVDKGSNDQDSFLDTVGGHGAFIAGIIERRAGGTPVQTVRVLDTQSAGLVSESTIHTTVAGVINALGAPAALNRTILCMSFGGPVWGAAGALAGAIHDAQAEGIVVIASAGNESTCEPQYPAAVPGVVSVGAIGPDGPADFTNYGPWVRCCAPGVDIVSTFFDHDFGAEPGIDGDPDDFEGWAVWSGTSFAVPAVAAALLRHMALTGKTAKESVADVIDAPWLGRIPGLGTVVNA